MIVCSGSRQAAVSSYWVAGNSSWQLATRSGVVGSPQLAVVNSLYPLITHFFQNEFFEE